MKFELTPRGFGKYEFTDRYGEKCSLQDSSLASDYAIWFGIDNPEIKFFIPNEGWKEYQIDIPEGADLLHSGRMHLTREMVEELLPALQYFVEHGELPTGGLEPCCDNEDRDINGGCKNCGDPSF